MAKYAEIYEKLNFTAVMQTIAPTYNVMLDVKSLKPYAEEMIAVIKEKFFDEDIYIHYFSNGGCSIHEHILSEIAKPCNAHLRISGFIYDSSPAWKSSLTGARALTANIKSPIVKYFCSSLLWLALEIMSIFYPTGNSNFWAVYERDMYPCRSLYLYSSADTITIAAKIDMLVSFRQKKMGVDMIDSVCFQDAPHCTIFPLQPVRYTQAIENFIIQTRRMGHTVYR